MTSRTTLFANQATLDCANAHLDDIAGRRLASVVIGDVTIHAYNTEPLDLAHTLRRLADELQDAYEQWEEEHFPPGSDSVPLEMYEGVQ